MFVAGQSVYAGADLLVPQLLVAIPSAVKVFNWTATLYKGSISWETPMLYAFGFIGLFTIGGLTGLFLAALGLDVHVHDTYFVVAHFHYIMVGGTIMGYLGGLHYWWPKITGRMYPRAGRSSSALIVFVGFNLTFFPQFILGYLGMPRRYHAYPPEFQVLNVLSSAGASILGVGYLLPMIYLIWSLRYGKVAGSNPWGATGLEWRRRRRRRPRTSPRRRTETTSSPAPLPVGKARLLSEAGEQFFSLYFAMTGLHALHMIIGSASCRDLDHGVARTFTASTTRPRRESRGLYWHFVDIVWIFLFPLLYTAATSISGNDAAMTFS
jgi:heme/copper-type cytochrome/quinol oxidase subunit 1